MLETTLPRPHTELQLSLRMDHTEWFKRIGLLRPLTGPTWSRMAVCDDPPMHPPTLHTHNATVYCIETLGER